MIQKSADQQPPDSQGEPAAPAAARPITVVVRVRLQALAVPEPLGGDPVIVPALPGCITEGDTLEDVQAMVVEAAEGWLESQHDRRKADALRMMLGE